MATNKNEAYIHTWDKIRCFLANFLAMFAPTKGGRKRFRDKIRFYGLIKTVGQNKLPSKKHNKKIDIAFCFNGTGYKLAAVSIKSLLMASKGICNYNIYCVIDETVLPQYMQDLESIVADSKSNIIFKYANHDFDKSYTRQWPRAIYYRTMLPQLLPDVKTIIYADIDILFFNDLVELTQIDMSGKYLAGVRDYNNGYINSGFLMMNLEEIRRDGMYEKWIDASCKKKYKNPDQDLLNYTSRGKIIYLPLKYNFQPMRGKHIFTEFSDAERDDLKHNLVVLHYSNYRKPWSDRNHQPIYSEFWWDVAKTTGLY